MTMAAPPEHRRNKSSVLRSIVLTGHKRAPSDGSALKKEPLAVQPYHQQGFIHGAPLLPPDHPHSQAPAANYSRDIPIEPQTSPRKSQDTREGRPKGLHKKTLSSVSLRTLGRDKEKERTKDSRSREPSRTRKEDMDKSHKKSKSRTNLRGLFSKDKQAQDSKEPRDKENTTPPGTAHAPVPLHTPIWAEFSSQPLGDITTTSKVPLNDQRRSVEEEIARYTPSNYSPSKGRNFFDYGQPSLQKKPQAKERPKSFVGGSTASLLETLTRKKSDDRVPLGDAKGNGGRVKDSPSTSLAPRPPLLRASTDTSRGSRETVTQETTSPKKAANAEKRQSRVMAAVAAFNGKSKQADQKSTPATSPTKLDPKVVDAEFEEVLVRPLFHLEIIH